MRSAHKLTPVLTLGLALLLAGAAAGSRAFADPPAAPAAPAQAAPLVRASQVHWYGIYMERSKIGWARLTMEPVTREGRALYRLHGRIQVNMKSLGAERDMQLEMESLYDAQAPYAAVAGFSEQTQGAFTQRVELVGEPGAFTARITAGGQTRTQALPEQPVDFREAIALDLWFREPRAVGDTIRYRSFDLDDLESDEEQAVVTGKERTVVDGVPLTYYTAEQRSKKDGSVSTVRYDEHGTMISTQMMGVMEIRLEPEALAKTPGAPVDVFVARIARIDKPLGPPGGVAELVVDVRGVGAEHMRDGPRQRAAYDAQTQVLTLKLGAAHDPRVKATEEEIREALKEDPDHPIREASVVALAQAAVGDAATPRARVERLVAFVDTFIEDSYSAEPLSTLDIMKVRQGDCTEHSLLFSTLARALGIPARRVGGLMYMGDEVQAFGGHAWNEVVLDGIWVPVDPTWGQVEIDATHIRQGADGDNGQASYALGGARLKLVSIERRSK